MPRSSRSSGGRSAPRPSAPSGSRGTHTMANGSRPQQQPVPHQSQVPAQQQQQGRAPGLFGQMASTAAGVAVGSTMGHGLSSMLFGGGSSEPAEAQQAAPPSQWNDGVASQQSSNGINCEAQSKDFLRCLEATGNNMESCAFYLDQLKACQSAARPY